MKIKRLRFLCHTYFFFESKTFQSSIELATKKKVERNVRSDIWTDKPLM